MTVREYIGARYVPLFMGDWDIDADYEPLSIVQYQGNSYTSRQSVPHGVEIANEAYWALTGNYNAQVESYRQEVRNYATRTEANETSIANINNALPIADYNENATVTDAITAVENSANAKLAEKAFAFETVADMKAAENLFAGAICHTNGFHVSGDGGAAWYEISGTGIANEIDVIACGNLFANLITDNEVNVCTLGCKNDGTANCADILNYATQKYILYFKPGRYRLDSPFNVYNSIKGAIYNRLFYNNITPNSKFVTVLESNFDEASTGVLNVATTAENLDSLTIENICIKCNGDEYGINIVNNSQPKAVYIQRVNVFNCATIGIRCRPVSALYNSRVLYVDTVAIWHRRNAPQTYADSRGMSMEANAHDLYISNVEIMGFYRGIVLLNGGFARVDNAHIWCFPMNYTGQFDDVWYHSSGILCGDNTETLMTNIYLDTCWYPISMFPGARSKVVNCYVYYGINEGISSQTQLPIVHIPNTPTSKNANISLVNLLVHDNPGVVDKIILENITSEDFYCNVENATILTSKTFENAFRLGIEDSEYTINGSSSSNEFEEIANIYLTLGSVRLLVTGRWGQMTELMLFKNNSNLYAYNMSLDKPTRLNGLMYKQEGDFVKIYANATNRIKVKILERSTATFAMNYNNIRDANGNAKNRETGVLESDLTFFTPYWN